MAGNAHDTWSLDEEDTARVCLDEAREHDRFWQRHHARHDSRRAGLDYEDYAPAYCVGYAGQAQYGGEFDEAEKSMLSNWVRIKGDSRLSLDEARAAMRAAWDRAAALRQAAARQERAAAVRERAAQSVREQLERLAGHAAAWKDRLGGHLIGERPVGPEPAGMTRRQL